MMAGVAKMIGLVYKKTYEGVNRVMNTAAETMKERGITNLIRVPHPP